MSSIFSECATPEAFSLLPGIVKGQLYFEGPRCVRDDTHWEVKVLLTRVTLPACCSFSMAKVAMPSSAFC